MDTLLNPRQKYLALLVAILLSLSCSLVTGGSNPAQEIPTLEPATNIPAAAPSPTLPPAPADLLERIQVDYLYTSELITVLYPLYGDILDDFVIVTLSNDSATRQRLVVESEIVGYTSLAIDTVDIQPGETLEVRQNPRLLPEALDNLNAQRPADFHLTVSVMEGGEKQLVLEQTGETLVYARRDFPWAIEGFTSEEVYDLLAAMVMPNDPAVEELIRAAADYTDSGIIASGYSGATNDEDGKVWERLEAIWEAQSEVYDITYVDTPVDFTPGSVQRIRLPAEVLEQRAGNCIELALLYASAAEALRLEAAILLVPGHAFVAIRTDQEGGIYYPIETTLVGRSTFEDAVDMGADEFKEAMTHLEAGGEDESYGWVTIWSAREKGINPLPWH
jgi:hypothetical protein